MYLFDHDFKLLEHVEAENACFDTASNEWILKNGMLTVFPANADFPLSKRFTEKHLTFPETPKDFLEIEKQVDTLRLKELLAFIDHNREAGLDTKAYEVDFHRRIAMSFIPIILGIIAIPYSVRPKRQGGIGKDLTICGGWILGYWFLFSMSMSLGRSGALGPFVAVWGPCAVFLVFALYLVSRARTA